jgi:hypothetical protein
LGEHGGGPYKVRSIGENPVTSVAPAIANVIEDAVGVRIRDLPITAEKVYAAMQVDNILVSILSTYLTDILPPLLPQDTTGREMRVLIPTSTVS